MNHTTEHNAAACRASRHTRVQHLITADESSLAELEALLATLPICSTGPGVHRGSGCAHGRPSCTCPAAWW